MITQHRKIAGGETLALRVTASPLEPHRRGQTFDIVTEARAQDELVWEERSTMLRRDGVSPERVETKTHRREPPAAANLVESRRINGRVGAVIHPRRLVHSARARGASPLADATVVPSR